MGLFGAKPKEVAVAPTHGRVDDSTPRSMERQPTALRKQKSNLGPAGKMSRQLTRKMTAQKMEAEVAAAQHLHSKECDALVKNMRTLEGCATPTALSQRAATAHRSPLSCTLARSSVHEARAPPRCCLVLAHALTLHRAYRRAQ